MNEVEAEGAMARARLLGMADPGRPVVEGLEDRWQLGSGDPTLPDRDFQLRLEVEELRRRREEIPWLRG